jgi:transposase
MTLVAREQDAAARTAWRAMWAALTPERYVFLDETATPTTLTPTMARAPRGQRAVGRVPRGHRPQVSWLATLTRQGIGPSLVVTGPVDRDVFDTFVTDLLAPSLRTGQVVVLDNLSVHKSATARAAIEAAGCRMLFLPTYSPDFNPIEQAFAKAKQRLRRLQARSYETVVAAVGEALETITPGDCAGFFRAAGYRT